MSTTRSKIITTRCRKLRRDAIYGSTSRTAFHTAVAYRLNGKTLASVKAFNYVSRHSAHEVFSSLQPNSHGSRQSMCIQNIKIKMRKKYKNTINRFIYSSFVFYDILLT